MIDIEEQLKEQLKMIYDIMASEDFVGAVSSFCWKLYTKLKEKGFTDEQAINIVTAMSRSSNKS